MMKKIYYILFLLLAGFCFNSCVSEEEDLFDKSAAERMNEALTKYKAILQDDPQGWVMSSIRATVRWVDILILQSSIMVRLI